MVGIRHRPPSGSLGALKGNLILGAAWGLWHVVPYIQGSPYDARETAVWVACQAALFTVAARVLIVWLYNNTGKSVMAAILFHDTINVSYVLCPNNGSHYDPAITGAITAVAAVIVTALGAQGHWPGTGMPDGSCFGLTAAPGGRPLIVPGGCEGRR